MLQIRKLVLAVAAATAFSTSYTYALGLGDLAVKSSLDQPFEAEISLSDVKNLTSVEIRTQLASAEEFNKAGIERQFILSDLKFTPVLDAKGKSVIRVTSAKPIKDPYLNFLVEVVWPNGRLLREYTALLNPALYKSQATVYAAQSAPQQSAASATAQQYQVQKSDTLWQIAKRTSGDNSIQQAMLAIQDLNPDAFLGGNINRMESGQTLRLPTAEDMQRRSSAQAIKQVAQQNTNWKNKRSTAAPSAPAKRQLDATHRKQADPAPKKIEQTDSLKLVADTPGQAQKAADQGSAAEIKVLQNQLAVSKEDLDSTTLENEELKGRVSDLNNQLDKLQRLLELKNDQLAQLQHTIDAAAELNALENTDDNLVAEQGDLATVAAAETSDAQAKEADKNIVDKILDDPLLLAGAGAGALLALMLLLMAASRGNARKRAEQQLSSKEQAESAELSAAETDFLAASNLAEDDTASIDGSDDITADLELDQPATDTGFKEETTDPIAEANNYISFGRLTPAAELLSSAIEQEPQRLDLRLKHLEVLAGLDDKAGFSRRVQDISTMDGTGAEVEQIKALYPLMFTAETTEPTATAEPLLAESDFVEPSLAESVAEPIVETAADLGAEEALDLDAEFENLSELLTESGSTDKPVVPDFDLDLPELVTPATATADPLDTETTSDSEFDFDDFEFDLATSVEPELGADEAFSLPEVALDLTESSPVEPEALQQSNDLDTAIPIVAEDAVVESESESESESEPEPVPESEAAPQLEDDRADLEALINSLGVDDLTESAPALDNVEIKAPAPAAPDVSDDDDDFSFLSGTDETATKLDLARAYIDMGDTEGAQDILKEVLAEGTAKQQDDARELISQL